MAIIKPFKGIRYNLEKAVLKQVIAPPYDIISEKNRESLEVKSPYNIVKLILPQGEDKYRQAKKTLDAWISNNILIKIMCLVFIYMNRNTPLVSKNIAGQVLLV